MGQHTVNLSVDLVEMAAPFSVTSEGKDTPGTNIKFFVGIAIMQKRYLEYVRTKRGCLLDEELPPSLLVEGECTKAVGVPG